MTRIGNWGGLLGPVGSLEQVVLTDVEQVEMPERRTRRVALSGATHDQIMPRRARVWKCEIPHDSPREGYILDALEDYQSRELRPLIWYPAMAQSVNILDPEASLMDPARWSSNMLADMGARVMPWGGDGPRFYRSGATQDPAKGGTTVARTVWLSSIPVPHSTALTVSAVLTNYAGSSVSLFVHELDMTGATINTHTISGTGTLRRYWRSFVTKPTTVMVSIAIRDALTIVAPAVTMTDGPVGWGTGRGCMAAMVHVDSRNPVRAGVGSHIYSSHESTSFTVEEVMQ